MARPAKNTKAGRIATEKWRKTMLEKYGSKEDVHEFMRSIGSKGGSVSHPETRPFSVIPREWTSAYGRKGGAISSKSKDKASLEDRRRDYYYKKEGF